MNNPFLKYVMKEKKENIFHSSGYGKAQSGSTIGTASSESFAKRMEIDKNRQNIKKYSDSMVAEQRFNSGVRAKQYTPPEKTEKLQNTNIDNRPQRAQMDRAPEQRPITPPAYKTNFGRK